MLFAGVLGDYLGKRGARESHPGTLTLWEAEGICDSPACSSPLLSLIISTRAPMAPLPLFLSCGFHHHHLPPVLSQILPCASKLECSLEICLGHSPIPRHLLLPSSECLPYHRLASTAGVPGFPTLMAWLLPQLARHPSCREPQAIPGLPLLSSTPLARHAHYQRAKTPRGKCYLYLENHLPLHRQSGLRKASLWIRTGSRNKFAGH